MQYLLLVRHDDSFTPPSDLGPETIAWTEEMDARGVRRSGYRLSPAADGVVVHVQPDGRRLESRLARDGVQVAGYDIVDVDGAVQAIDIAAAHPMARWGEIEVREFWTAPRTRDTATPTMNGAEHD